MPVRAQRPRPWAMIVGLALIAVLAVVIVIALLVTGSPDEATATPTPTASSSATAAESPSATPEPSPSQVAEPSAPELPDGLLPAGAVITINVEFVRIRSEPSLAGKVVDRMLEGDAAYVENAIDAGPVMADGFAWYRVAYAAGRDVWPFQDVVPGSYETGWMAAGDEGGPYVVLAEVACPSEPITLDTLANGLTPWERLVCIGSGTVTVEGRYGCDGCGGVVAGAQPAWLADATQHPPLAAPGNFYPAVNISVPPKARQPKGGDIIRGVLHVDDPAASTCTFDPPAETDAAAFEYDPTAVRLYCRERLVLESFVVTGHDDFPN